MKKIIHLSKDKRFAELHIKKTTKKIIFDSNRLNCRDVLVEFVDLNAHAQSKPLSKTLGTNMVKDLSKLRFIMNEMSNKPITISITEK